MPTTEADTFTIRELADEFAITTRTIRFYEDKGLITPIREGQKRIYSKRDRARLKLILRGKRLGFSLDEIVNLVRLYETPEDTLPQLEVYLSTLQHHKTTLLQQKQDLEETLLEIERAENDAKNAIDRLAGLP